MSEPKYTATLAILLMSLPLLFGCDRKPPQAHVWQDQVQTLDKARGAQKQAEDAAAAQQHDIDQQTR